MKYRHEWKHEINYADLLILRARLGAVMQTDCHAIDGKYQIRTLYFDDWRNTALREKIDGVNRREKFRIRYYNGDLSYLSLEKKSKVNGLCLKQSSPISPDEARRLIAGDLSWMPGSNRPVCEELYRNIIFAGLRPKTIVDYTREAFVFAPGNVRVTLDYNIRTGLASVDFLNPATVTVPAGDAPIILEVKWDEFLPDIIRHAVALPDRRVSAFSKYAQCRIYG